MISLDVIDALPNLDRCKTIVRPFTSSLDFLGVRVEAPIDAEEGARQHVSASQRAMAFAANTTIQNDLQYRQYLFFPQGQVPEKEEEGGRHHNQNLVEREEEQGKT